MTQPRVYIASPYSLRTDKAVAESEAREAAALLMLEGLAAFAPVAFGADVERVNPFIRHRWKGDDWLAWCLPWLECADVMVVLQTDGWSASAGIRAEMAFWNAPGRPMVMWDPREDSAEEVAARVRAAVTGGVA